MYVPLSIKSGSPKENQTVSMLGKKGMNLRDLPQMLNVDHALNINNYIITSDGGLRRRKGYSEEYNGSSTDPITMLIKYTDDILLYTFSNKLYAYSFSAGTSSSIKTDFTTADPFSGAKYGDYAFLCNGGDKIGRVSQTLGYDAQTANFATGEVLTGGTSGATAIILEDSDSGTSGTLTLGSISGTFQDGETITDSATGSADVNGTASFTYTEITTAPKARILKVFGPRLYAGDLSTDRTAVQYSEVDEGTNPPFTTWSIDTGNTQGGAAYYRNGGIVKAIEKLGEHIIVFQEKGKFGFKITQIDSAGTLKKIEQTAFEREDFGASIATISTDKGIFYANREGFWQMVALGTQDIPFDDQEFETTEILGRKYFDDVTFDNAALAYHPQLKYVFLTCAKDSTKNNLIIGYSTEFKAVSTITGWNVNRFLWDDDTMYGASANGDDIFKLFDGFDDNGIDIYTTFEQEITVGSLETRQMLRGFYIQGLLSPSTTLKISLSIFDRNGVYVPDKTTWEWGESTQSSASGGSGFGATSFGGGSWGGAPSAVSGSTMSENFNGFRPFIRNFQRLRVKITANDKVDHQINWFSIMTNIKKQIRRRGINQLT
jgi:hypothetical protein